MLYFSFQSCQQNSVTFCKELSNVSMFYLQRFYKTLCLAYQSLGVVYGDLSISPIYVYKSTFSGSLRPYKEDHEILGVLSLVFWTLTLIPLCKYIIFVLAADDSGEGAHNDPFHNLYG